MSVPEREVVVIGYGFEYLVMALNCARSIRTSNPGLATTLITNIPVESSELTDWFDSVVVRDAPSDQNRRAKTRVLDFASASAVLYLDADAEVVGDLGPAFGLLERFDVVLRMHPGPVNKPFQLASNLPGQLFPHMSGGMFLLRNGAPARRFLAQWDRRLVESGLSRDQPALARAVYDLPETKLLMLNAVWLADEFEHAALFTTKHEQPRIRHYAHPHTDASVSRRLRATIDDVLPRLPASVLKDPDVERVRMKYRHLTHPMFVSPLTRRIYLAVLNRWYRLRGRQRVDLFDRRSAVAGRAYTKNAGQLWVD